MTNDPTTRFEIKLQPERRRQLDELCHERVDLLNSRDADFIVGIKRIVERYAVTPRCTVAKLLARDEARRIAANIASCRSCGASGETPETTSGLLWPGAGPSAAKGYRPTTRKTCWRNRRGLAGTPGEKVKNNPMQGRTARNVQMMTTAVAGSFACARQRRRVPRCVP